MFDLDNKVILVVGGRGYLGREFCDCLSKQNAKVISADLGESSLAASKSGRKYDDSDVLNLDIDVTNKDSVSSVIETVIKDFGKIDVLIFSVTAKPKDFYAPYTECSLDGWQKVIRTELDGVFLVTQAVGRVMEKQKSGSIILM